MDDFAQMLLHLMRLKKGEIVILFVLVPPFGTKCVSIIKSCGEIANWHLLAELFRAKCVSAAGSHVEVCLRKNVRI